MNKRIYLVTGPNGVRLVDATSAAQAVRFVTKNEYRVNVATSRQVAQHAPTHPVEDAGGEDSK